MPNICRHTRGSGTSAGASSPSPVTAPYTDVRRGYDLPFPRAPPPSARPSVAQFFLSRYAYASFNPGFHLWERYVREDGRKLDGIGKLGMEERESE